jgi:hypothetical protein
MKAALIALAVIVVIAVALFVVWTVGFKRMARDIGRPTPEEARVKIDKAEAKANAETQAEVKKVHDATIEETLRRAREYINRGMHGK